MELTQLKSNVVDFDARWQELSKSMRALPQAETQKILEESVYDAPKPFLTNHSINGNLNLNFLNVTSVVERTSPKLQLSSPEQVHFQLQQQLSFARQVPIDILSDTLFPFQGHLNLFCRLLRGAISRGCHIRLIIAGSVSPTFCEIFPEPDVARSRLKGLISELGPLLGQGLDLYLHAGGFVNPTYRFGDKLFVTYLMESSSSHTTANILSHKHNQALFDEYVQRFNAVLDKCQPALPSQL